MATIQTYANNHMIHGMPLSLQNPRIGVYFLGPFVSCVVVWDNTINLIMS